jgi:hypothetical protein
VGFVQEAQGEAGLAGVRAELHPDLRASFGETLRESEWYPLSQLVAFLAAAKRAVAPGDAEFYRKQGRYAGGRQKTFLGAMVSPEARAKLASTVWRMFFDVGTLTVVGEGEEAASQIHGFPTTPELCQRFLGSWEGVASTPDHEAVATEARCVLRGDGYCEFRVR